MLCVREVVSGKCVSTQDKKKKELREKRSWSKGRMLPSQGSDPGSSPGGRIFVRSFEGVKVKKVSIRGIRSHRWASPVRKSQEAVSVESWETCLIRCVIGE